MTPIEPVPTPIEARDEAPVRVVLRGAAELIDDAAIAQVYPGTPWMFGAGLVVPLGPSKHPLLLDFDAAWHRLGELDQSLNLVPLALVAELPIGHGLFIGAGPTVTLFSETHPADATGVAVTRGARIAAELRAGGRFDTGLVQEPMPPSTGGPVHALEFEVYVARRQERPGHSDGFDLGAWRGVVGLSLCF